VNADLEPGTEPSEVENGDPTAQIRVLLVDDHAVVRRGLTDLLSGAPGIEVVGEAADGAEAVTIARTVRPDVVLMDLQMAGVDGVEATRLLQAEPEPPQVLVLTSFSDRERIVAALDAGAVGYLLKDADPDDVIAGVRAVGRGESPLHPRAARELLLARTDVPSSATTAAANQPKLTPREVEVLQLVRAGLANKQIARKLSISERTVKAHLTSAFQRIGVMDRTQAALWADRNGI
jgi:DNA-binding NarL/FixJ family response regulator